jgi:microcystin-dependent protein
MCPTIHLTDPKNGTLTDAQVIESNNTILENLLNGQLDATNLAPALGLGIPPGVTVPFAGSAAPAGWLIADGSPVDRGLYANLFAAIGTTWGAGDGSTTFNLPDLRDRVPVGRSATKALASAGGEETHTLSAAEMPYHEHSGGPGIANYAGTSLTAQVAAGAAFAAVNAGTPNTGGPTVAGGAAHNNLPPYRALNYIVKT